MIKPLRTAFGLIASALLGLSALLGCAPQEHAPLSSRSQLLERIGDINDFSKPRPLVTLREFFEGNADYSSIGYNLPDPPSPAEFYSFLKQVEARDDVREVRVQVQQLEDANGWPSTDTLWIITSATAEEVAGWFPERIAPDDVLNGFEADSTMLEPLDVPPGMNAIGAWYD